MVGEESDWLEVCGSSSEMDSEGGGGEVMVYSMPSYIYGHWVRAM